MTETANEKQRLYRAYSQRYESESKRRRFTFVVDIAFAVGAGFIGVAQSADVAQQFANSVSTWIPLVALLWLVLRESGIIVGTQLHRLEAARIQEQLDLMLWKNGDWREGWNGLLAGDPIPSTKITRFADGHTGRLADDYFVGTTGCSPERGAALRIAQTASWGSTDHWRYGKLNQVAAVAGVLLLILVAYAADWSTRDTSTIFLAVAPLLVGRFQSYRSHDSLATRREVLEAHARRVADLPVVSDSQIRTMQDELFRLRIEERRIPAWVYKRGQASNQRTLDSDVAQLAARVCRDHAAPSRVTDST